MGNASNEPVEVVIRPEDLRITLPEEGKLQVKVDTQLFRGVHYEIIAVMIWEMKDDPLHSEGHREKSSGDFEPEDIHVMSHQLKKNSMHVSALNNRQQSIIRDEETTLIYLSSLISCDFSLVLGLVVSDHLSIFF